MIIPSIIFLYEVMLKVDNDSYLYGEAVEQYLSSIDNEVLRASESKPGKGKPWNERISHYLYMNKFIKEHIKPCKTDKPLKLVLCVMKKHFLN